MMTGDLSSTERVLAGLEIVSETARGAERR
jgi:hypothetical protein